MPTVALAPIPKWYFPDNFGRPLGAGKMYTYSNINKQATKPVYQDHLGTLRWTNPILFDLNGLQGPFYWETNTLNPDDTYFLIIKDKDDVLQFTIENYSPTGGGGGGGGNIFVSLKNLISNNIFYFNNLTNGSPFPTPISQTDFIIAPGPFVGLNPSKADIRFIKSDMAQTDFLNFIDFNLGEDPFFPDVTPSQYLRYECTAAPSAQSIKVVQFPITSKVNNLDNQPVTFTIWARSETGPSTLQLFDWQFFGSPNGTLTVPLLRATFPLDGTWKRCVSTFSVNTTSGKTLGTCGDDAYYIQVGFPLDAPCQIWIAKPCLYLGNLDPGKDYDTNDQVMSQIAGPRPGDIRIGINNFVPFGWVEMNDSTIGNTNSGAPNRANVDTFPLFKIIWTSVSEANAPIFTSAGAPTTRGASAEADFDANKRLALTKTAGRALAGIGTPSTGGTNWGLGQVAGSETQALTSPNQLPAHNHSASGTALTPVQLLTSIPDGPFQTYGPFSPPHPGTEATLPLTIAVGNTGASAPFSIIQPTVHYRIFAKL